MDKLTEVYSLEIPAIIKETLETLPKEYIVKLNQEIRILMAKTIHESKFKPENYLGVWYDMQTLR